MKFIRITLLVLTSLLVVLTIFANFIPSIKEVDRPISPSLKSIESERRSSNAKFLNPKYIIDIAGVYGIKVGNIDNTEALMRLNKDFAGFGKGLVLFDFRNCGTGEIRYSDNSWLYGIDSFIVSAKGIAFRCTSSSPWDVAKAPLYNSGIFWSSRRPDDHTRFNAGFRFKSALKGSSSITLLEPATIKPGQRVYLCGYEEQFYGEPVNPRFFEWKVVQGVSGDNVNFTQPLKWSYNERWKDVMMPGFNDGGGYGLHGKPRLFKISDSYTTYAKFVGCTFAKGTNVSSNQAAYFFFRAETLICDGCTIDENWPTETKNALFINCTIRGSDADKNVGTLEYNNCKTGGIFAATGVDVFRLINNTITGYCPLSPRELYAEGNIFTARKEHNLYAHPEGVWTEKVYLKNNKFSGPNNPHVQYAWSVRNFTTIGANTNELIVADTNYFMAKGLGQNSSIQSKDGATAIVKDIIHNDTNWVVQLSNVHGKLKANQIWTYNNKQKIIDLGGNKSLTGKKIF
jgi:hypothetical protein